MIADHIAQVDIAHIISVEDEKILRKKISEVHLSNHISKTEYAFLYLLNSVGFIKLRCNLASMFL